MVEVLTDRDCRIVIKLRVIEYTYEDIAKVLFCHPVTIRRNLKRRGHITRRLRGNIESDYKRVCAETP